MSDRRAARGRPVAEDGRAPPAGGTRLLLGRRGPDGPPALQESGDRLDEDGGGLEVREVAHVGEEQDPGVGDPAGPFPRPLGIGDEVLASVNDEDGRAESGGAGPQVGAVT